MTKITANMQVTGMKREFQTGESLKAHVIKYTAGIDYSAALVLTWDELAEEYNTAMRTSPEWCIKLDHRYGFYSAHLERQLAAMGQKEAQYLSDIDMLREELDEARKHIESKKS